MSDESIKETVREYIVKEFLPGEPIEKVTDDLPLMSSRLLDSLATLKLVAFLEEHFEIELEAHEVGEDNLDTVAMIGSFVEGRKG